MQQPIVFFDLETTGKSITNDRIVSLHAKKLAKTSNGFQLIEAPVDILCKPGVPIKPEAEAIHGVTNDMVKDAEPFSYHAPGLYVFFQDCILSGFNIKAFDIPMLSEEFARCGMIWPLNDSVTVFDAYSIFVSKEQRTLSAAYQLYTGKPMQNAHNAGADVDATIEVFAGQMQRYPDLCEMNPGELHLFCSNGVKTLDLAGKIYINKDGVPCFSFGKSKDVPVKKDTGFAEWMLKSDFPMNTKSIIRKILNS